MSSINITIAPPSLPRWKEGHARQMARQGKADTLSGDIHCRECENRQARWKSKPSMKAQSRKIHAFPKHRKAVSQLRHAVLAEEAKRIVESRRPKGAASPANRSGPPATQGQEG